MADNELAQSVLQDLLSRVKKLEASRGTTEEDKEILIGLDRMAYVNSVSINSVSNILLEKKIITQEEIKKAAAKEQQRIDGLMRGNVVSEGGDDGKKDDSGTSKVSPGAEKETI